MLLKNKQKYRSKKQITSNNFLKSNFDSQASLKNTSTMTPHLRIYKPIDLNKRNSSIKKIRLVYATPPINYSRGQKENSIKSKQLTTTTSPLLSPFDCTENRDSILTFDRKMPHRNDFNFMYCVGSGGFGRVWKVQEKRTGQIWAMKEISKTKVILKKSVVSVMNQRQILQLCNHKFLINMKTAFQDRRFLYMTRQYLRGADLRYHLCFKPIFTQAQTKFITCCIIQGLEYIHSKNIIHRDLKPQNLVFQQNGYIRITDFGVARKFKQNNCEQTSGTPGYMAPQVICRMNHSFQADFFALGVIIYELMLRMRPYYGQSRKEIRDKILAHQARITSKELPQDWSANAMDFVNRLLKRNRQSRLGYKGIQQLKRHPWLNNISWKKLSIKKIPPPFVPGIVTQSIQYQNDMQTTMTQPNQEAQILLRTVQMQDLFRQYHDNRCLTKPHSIIS